MLTLRCSALLGGSMRRGNDIADDQDESATWKRGRTCTLDETRKRSSARNLDSSAHSKVLHAQATEEALGFTHCVPMRALVASAAAAPALLHPK